MNTSESRRIPAAPRRDGKPAAEAEILFQHYFKSVGPRTYAAQVKKAGNGNHFLVFTEGKRDDSGEVRKTRLFVFSEDFAEFFKMLHETAVFIRQNPVPPEVRKKREKFWAKQNAQGRGPAAEMAPGKAPVRLTATGKAPAGVSASGKSSAGALASGKLPTGASGKLSAGALAVSKLPGGAPASRRSPSGAPASGESSAGPIIARKLPVRPAGKNASLMPPQSRAIPLRASAR